MVLNGSKESDKEYRFKCALIEEVKNHPCLYDKANPLHFKTHVTNDEFAEIAVTLRSDCKPFGTRVKSTWSHKQSVFIWHIY